MDLSGGKTTGGVQPRIKRRVVALVVAALALMGIGRAFDSANSQVKTLDTSITCYGIQEIVVRPGQTATGILEEYLQTDPRDRLKNSDELRRIAKAIKVDGVDQGKELVIRGTYTVGSLELMAGNIYQLPQRCERGSR